MVEELPQFKPRTRGMKIRYPIQTTKAIIKQSLQALAFLHENNITHGDFQPGNILFALDNIDNVPEDALRQEEDVQTRSISPPVQRLDGKQDQWAPRYLCIAQPLVQYTPYTRDCKIKLSDMGGGEYLLWCHLTFLFLWLTALVSFFFHGTADKGPYPSRPSNS